MPFRWHEEYFRDAREIGAERIMVMPARDFLWLTTLPDGSDMYPTIDDVREAAQPLEAYNRERTGPVYLRVTENGTVTGHEGRHRAAAVMNEEGEDAEIIVAIQYEGEGRWPLMWRPQFRPYGSVYVGNKVTEKIDRVLEEMKKRRNPAWGIGRGRGYKFEGTEEILDLIESSEPNFDFVEEPDEDAFAEVIHGRNIVWLSDGHYVLRVPVENVSFMEGNMWFPEHGAALVELAQSGEAKFELPAARVYRITKKAVRLSEKYDEEGELESQMDMVEPWSMSDVGDYYAHIVDGNHRAAAAMITGEPYIYVYVAENYRGNVKPGDWE